LFCVKFVQIEEGVGFMLKVALCDDNEKECAAIGKLLQEYAAARPRLAVKLSVFSSGQSLLAAEEEEGFDLYVLDVVMPGLSGIDLGIKLRELGSSGAIVYLTISPEYAMDSYNVHAFHYLLKPVKPAHFYHVLDEAAVSVKRQKSACVMVKTKDRLQRIQLDDILYAELAGRIMRYHLFNGEIVDSVTLRGPFQEEAAALLADSRFILCGVSFVVNLYYVTAIEKKFLLLDNGSRVPLSRNLAAQVRQQWSNYWLDWPKEESQ